MVWEEPGLDRKHQQNQALLEPPVGLRPWVVPMGSRAWLQRSPGPPISSFQWLCSPCDRVEVPSQKRASLAMERGQAQDCVMYQFHHQQQFTTFAWSCRQKMALLGVFLMALRLGVTPDRSRGNGLWGDLGPHLGFRGYS